MDCKVGEWSEWSDCTAQCGGGVQQRARSKSVEPANGGEPCPEQSDTKACNVQGCNADCALADWGDWSLCSKACDEGREQRTRKVIAPKRGVGECAADNDPTRMNFRTCNEFECSTLLPPGREVLQCIAMLDLVLLIDGSGSLGDYGWAEIKNMSSRLVKAMVGNATGVNVAILLFSGPDTREDLEACTSSNPDAAPDMEAQCSIKWIKRLSGNIPEVTKSVGAMEWPAKTTLTSVALGEARSELVSGRQDAASVVAVVTDGKPMSPIKTGRMADELKAIARLVWIPVGSVPEDTVTLMKKWSTEPWEDNFLHFPTFSTLDLPKTLNKVISGICPLVQ